MEDKYVNCMMALITLHLLITQGIFLLFKDEPTIGHTSIFFIFMITWVIIKKSLPL